jgi:epoxyqueuosine reductase
VRDIITQKLSRVAEGFSQYKTAMKNNQIIKNLIKETIGEVLGEERPYILGFSHVKGFVPERAEGLEFCITIGLKLDDDIIDSINEGPTPEYFEHYWDINKNLKTISERIQDHIANHLGRRALAMLPTTPEDEKKTEKFQKELGSDFSHKIGATQSGLGWIGKTALFISKRFGPRLRLVSILTDFPLDAGTPINESLCGECTICVDRCPAAAGSGIKWKKGMKREDFFNPHQCAEACKKLTKERLNEERLICGICVAICPFGKDEKP